MSRVRREVLRYARNLKLRIATFSTFSSEHLGVHRRGENSSTVSTIVLLLLVNQSDLTQWLKAQSRDGWFAPVPPKSQRFPNTSLVRYFVSLSEYLCEQACGQVVNSPRPSRFFRALGMHSGVSRQAQRVLAALPPIHCAGKIGKIVGSCWKTLFPNAVDNLSSDWKSRPQTPNT